MESETDDSVSIETDEYTATLIGRDQNTIDGQHE